MGTNFYWHDDALVCKNACGHCAADSVIHVRYLKGTTDQLEQG